MPFEILDKIIYIPLNCFIRLAFSLNNRCMLTLIRPSMGRERLRDDAKMAAGRLDFNKRHEECLDKTSTSLPARNTANKGHEVSL